MTSKFQKIKCLFGKHVYTIPHKEEPDILLCKHCKRHGYYVDPDTFEIWIEYDADGEVIDYKERSKWAFANFNTLLLLGKLKDKLG